MGGDNLNREFTVCRADSCKNYVSVDQDNMTILPA